MAMDQEWGLGALRRAEARLRFHGDRESVGDVVAAAVALLVAGMDTPNLRVLAGEDRSEPREVIVTLHATLRDLELAPQSEVEAGILLAADLARRGMADEASARDVAPLIWRLYGPCPDYPWPDTFVQLALAADAVEDLPWWDEAMPWFMKAARDFLAAHG